MEKDMGKKQKKIKKMAEKMQKLEAIKLGHIFQYSSSFWTTPNQKDG